MRKAWIWIGTVVAALAAAFLCLVLDFGSLTDVANDALIVPRGSPIWVSYQDEYDGGSAHTFVGSFAVSGTYYYGREFDGGESAAFVVPDKAVAAVLPHWKRWGPPKRIDLTNPADFAKAVLPQRSADRTVRQSMATGHITIVIADYEVTGECDAPIYRARFKEIYRPEDRLALTDNRVHNCG